jgi:hypothetical protein
MAERTGAKKLTANELIVRKLKETFDREGIDDADGANVWVMAAAAKPFQQGEENEPARKPSSQKPTHRVRVVLRTTDAQIGTNPYVDGSDFFLAVDEKQQTAEFVWEDESFADAPLLHGSEVLTAIRWTTELAESLLCVRLEDPFSTKTAPRRPGNETKQETKGGVETWM